MEWAGGPGAVLDGRGAGTRRPLHGGWFNTMYRLLLVDDDDDIRAIGEIALAHVGGFDVVLAASGLEAFDVAQRTRPDVILLDMMMPDLDGLGTLELLRANPWTASIPVIFMTARVQHADVDHYLSAGAVAVIAKPFDPMTVASEVRGIVERTSPIPG